MVSAIDEALAEGLRERRHQGLYRQRQALQGPQGVLVSVADEELVNFSSNDYLGLANDPRLPALIAELAEQWGLGSGASHLVSGHSEAHAELEQHLAGHTGRERALLFTSGFTANLAVAGSLTDRQDAIFGDRLNHASLVDGALASRARYRRYRHGDADHLDWLLARTPARRKLVLTDAIFSMDGDRANLADLAEISNRHAAWLMVDDAHGYGMSGPGGGGSLLESGLDGTEVPILMATLGKAIGAQGAFVAGSEALVETLIQSARSYIYTTATAPLLAATALHQLRWLQSENWRQEKLSQNIGRLRRLAAQHSLQLTDSDTPIQPFIVGEPEACVAVSQRMHKRGFLVPAIRTPTVPKGTDRLRITLSALHTDEQIAALVKALAESLE